MTNARNLANLLGGSTTVPTTALPTNIQTLDVAEIPVSKLSLGSNVLTQSFDSNQSIDFNLTDSVNASIPIVSAFKEVPVTGVISKGNWDVNANATNYEFFDEKPISYSSSTLTPSATGDGTFTNSAANTSGFAVSAAAYDNVSFSASSQVLTGGGIAFKPDGLTMYLVNSNNDNTFQYTLTTAFDISTASYANKTYTHSETATGYSAGDIVFKPDGTKYWLIAANTSTGDRIFQYSMSTAWDISTSSYDSVSFATTGINIPTGLAFNPDGTRLFMSGYSGATDKPIRQVDLSTAWDLSTATYNSVSFDTSPVLGQVSSTDFPTSLHLNSDGTKIFVSTKGSDKIYEYAMSTAYDLSTISYSNVEFSVTTEEQDLWAITFSNDGTKMYAFGYNDTVYQYSSAVSLAFNSADVGKKVVGNSGSAIITATSGTYTSVTPFADTSAISSWQLFGAEGKSDGTGIELSGYSAGYDISSPSNLKTWATAASPAENIASAMLGSDGTKGFYLDQGNDQVVYITLSTAFDISTATRQGAFSMTAADGARGLYIFGDGTRVFTASPSGDYIRRYDLSTPWDVSSVTQFGYFYQVAQESQMNGLEFKPDGTKMYVCGTTNNTAYQYSLSTAWDITTASYDNKSLSVSDVGTSAMDLRFNSDGTKLFSMRNTGQILTYNLSTPWDISTGSYSSSETWVTGYTNVWGFSFANNGKKILISNYGANPDELVMYDTGSTLHSYSQYSPALTNSSTGQINSASWLDINSMTADETKNGGDIFYAVSTDNRTSWGVAKASDGVRKIARNNSGTWQYNNHAGTNNPWQYNSGAASGNTLTISSAFNYGSWLSGGGTHTNANVKFSPDGTKIFWAPGGGNSDADDIYTANLSTAWDLSTATQGPIYTEYSSSGYGQASFAFNSDGTKLYTVVRHSTSSTNRRIRQWSLSTAYDVSTSSYVGQTAYISNSAIRGIYVSSDESYFITNHQDTGRDYIKKWNLATAGDITSSLSGETAVDVTTYTNWSAPAVGLFWATAPDFFDSGNKMIMLNHGGGGSNTNDVYLIELSTAYDITSGTVIGKFTSATGADLIGVSVKPDGTKLYASDGTGGIVEFNTGSVNYETSETWVNGTNNNEHATLQEALGAQSFNRMNKAQLDAVADAYHFSQDSADTLDLMIAPYAASGSSPISDGVTINYDAEAIVREAVNGTDYVAEFPQNDKVKIKSLIDGNLKIRII